MAMETIERSGDDIGIGFEPALLDIEAAEEDILISGLYHVAPLARRSSASASSGYDGERFSRSRHHRDIPERVVEGLNAGPVVDPDLLSAA
jgi:hypothetical protein